MLLFRAYFDMILCRNFTDQYTCAGIVSEAALFHRFFIIIRITIVAIMRAGIIISDINRRQTVTVSHCLSVRRIVWMMKQLFHDFL